MLDQLYRQNKFCFFLLPLFVQTSILVSVVCRVRNLACFAFIWLASHCDKIVEELSSRIYPLKKITKSPWPLRKNIRNQNYKLYHTFKAISGIFTHLPPHPRIAFKNMIKITNFAQIPKTLHIWKKYVTRNSINLSSRITLSYFGRGNIRCMTWPSRR